MPGSSFTPEGATALQEALAAERTLVAWPECGTDVALGMPVAGAGRVRPGRYIRCERCDATP